MPIATQNSDSVLYEQTETVKSSGRTVAQELDRVTREDVQFHRVTQPVRWEDFDHNSCLLHPRFGIVQEREDGSVKVRPIDHLSWSPSPGRKSESVNGHTWRFGVCACAPTVCVCLTERRSCISLKVLVPSK